MTVLQFRQFDGSSQKTIGRDERDRRRDRGDGEETGVQRGSGPFQKPALAGWMPVVLGDSCCGEGTLEARYKCTTIDERDSSRYGSVLGGGLQGGRSNGGS